MRSVVDFGIAHSGCRRLVVPKRPTGNENENDNDPLHISPHLSSSHLSCLHTMPPPHALARAAAMRRFTTVATSSRPLVAPRTARRALGSRSSSTTAVASSSSTASSSRQLHTTPHDKDEGALSAAQDKLRKAEAASSFHGE